MSFEVTTETLSTSQPTTGDSAECPSNAVEDSNTKSFTSYPENPQHQSIPSNPYASQSYSRSSQELQLASISATNLLNSSSNNKNINNHNNNIGPTAHPKVEIKLFVGRLPRTIDEATLAPLFEAFGDVVETVIIRDKATGTPTGSGFVKMASLTAADAAVRALHNMKVVDSQLGPIQVKYANGEPERLGLSPDAAQPGSDIGKLFVGSLPRTITEPEVREVFEPFGRVDEVVLMKDSATGQAKGCAFVKFAFKENAINAIKFLHGQHTFSGCPRPLEVKFAESRRAAAAANQMIPSVAGSLMPGYGAVNAGMGAVGTGMRAIPTGMIPPQPSNLNPRSVAGWTEYFTSDGRAYYHHELSKVTQWTKPIEFERMFMPHQPAVAPPVSCNIGSGSDIAGPPGANVFVFHIPNEWGQNEVVSQFSQYGRVISCYVATDRSTGRNKGYGFVSYDNIQSAASAVIGMSGFPVGTKRLKVSIKTGEEQYVAHLLKQQHSTTTPQQQTSNLVTPPPTAATISGYGPVGIYGNNSNHAMGYNRTSPY